MTPLQNYFKKLDKGERHNIPSQLNVVVPDLEAPETGFGKHERVVMFEPQFESDYGCVCRYARVDIKYGLPLPTEEDLLKVMRAWPIEGKGRYKEIARIPYESGGSQCIDIYLKAPGQ